jgi:hypothetical protein
MTEDLLESGHWGSWVYAEFVHCLGSSLENRGDFCRLIVDDLCAVAAAGRIRLCSVSFAIFTFILPNCILCAAMNVIALRFRGYQSVLYIASFLLCISSYCYRVSSGTMFGDTFTCRHVVHWANMPITWYRLSRSAVVGSRHDGMVRPIVLARSLDILLTTRLGPVCGEHGAVYI